MKFHGSATVLDLKATDFDYINSRTKLKVNENSWIRHCFRLKSYRFRLR